MVSTIALNRVQSNCESWRERFLVVLPGIERQAHIYFCHDRCCRSRDEKLAETVAVCWRWFLRLAERGKDANRFVSELANLAARVINSGRRVCGQETASAVLSPSAQRQGQCKVCPPPEAAAFRIDFSQSLRFWNRRHCRLIVDLMQGEGTLAVARKRHLTAGQVSQLRRQFHLHWLIYSGQVSDDGQAEVAQAPGVDGTNCLASLGMGVRS